jgi:flagellar basal body rod protein FlgG
MARPVMNVGIYQGAAALTACENWQQITSRNIASSTVPGFHRTEVSFAGVLGDSMRTGGASQSGQTVRGSMPQSVSKLDLQPGELRQTGEELDFAIQGTGFFKVQRTDGSAGYTRDGGFHTNAERVLVNRQGFAVQGDGGPVTLRAEGGRVSVNADGTIVQGDTQIGKIAVYDFSDTSKLQAASDGLLVSSDASVQPTTVERPEVITGAIESSNVRPLQEMVNLITLSRSFEAAQRVIQISDEASDKAIQTLGNTNA